MREALSDENLPEGSLSPDPEVEDHYSDLEREACLALALTTPTTLPGLVALLDYVEGLSSGRLNPKGLRDNAFDDEMTEILAGALECLKAHITGPIPSSPATI